MDEVILVIKDQGRGAVIFVIALPGADLNRSVEAISSRK